MSELSAFAQALADFCAEGGRVSPAGQNWHRLWKLLPEDAHKTGKGRTAPLPLILAAASCEAWEKRLRLREHIAWADAHCVIEAADSFLRNLPPDDWEYS